jgi:Ca-activated chloride channel family protein
MNSHNRNIEKGLTALFLLAVFACFSLDLTAGQGFRDSSVSTENSTESTTGETDVLKRPQDSLILGMNVDSVSILVTARNKKGDYIGNLNATDFQILEDGEEQPIRQFRQDTIPVNVVFLVDASYSVNDVLQNIIESAVTFAGHLRAGDKFSAVIFAHKPIKVLDWTDNVPAFQNILRNVKTFGKTALYDSMEFTIENMFDKVQGKKAIIILSDGVDNSSTKSLTKVMRLAADREVTVYPIIHSYPQSQHFREMAKNNRQKLQNVSKFFLAYIDAQNEFIDLVARNGGRIIFSNGYTDLKDIYDVLVEELKNQYALSYVPQVRPATEKDFKEVTVKLRNKPGEVFVRLGYFQEQ